MAARVGPGLAWGHAIRVRLAVWWPALGGSVGSKCRKTGEALLCQNPPTLLNSFATAGKPGPASHPFQILAFPWKNTASPSASCIRLLAEGSRVSGPFGTVRYTVSGGYARWHPGESLAQLTARADTALYMAKLSGRNRMLAHVPAPAADSAPAELATGKP